MVYDLLPIENDIYKLVFFLNLNKSAMSNILDLFVF